MINAQRSMAEEMQKQAPASMRDAIAIGLAEHLKPSAA
jgi:hypothetical protein